MLDTGTRDDRRPHSTHLDSAQAPSPGYARPCSTFSTLPERGHLPRLESVFAKNPLYFLTTCVADRRPIIANQVAAAIIADAFRASPHIHRWNVGRYVIMPNHIHFFARPCPSSKPLHAFMRDFKKWTAKRLAEETNLPAHLWQPEYFDHVLRTAESYAEKWDYVRNNPVRAGLVEHAEEWPYWGECGALVF